MGAFLGTLASWVYPFRRRLVLENLKESFPEKNGGEVLAISKEVWRNVGRTAAEFTKIPSLSKSDFGGILEAQGLEHVDRALEAGKGLLFLCSHIGNWEVLGATYTINGRSAAVVARPIKNPYVDRWVNDIRRTHGEDVITHHQILREGIRYLKKNKPVAVLMDHNLYTGGEFVDFLGRPAATTTIISLLSLRLGCPVVPARNIRIGKKLKAVFEPAIWPEETGDRERDVTAMTVRLSRVIEGWVREHPDQWFWLHNRWKRKSEAVPESVLQ